MVYDPTYPTIDPDDFQRCDWDHYYEGATKAIPVNAPKPRGKEVDLRAMVDSDHETRRSRTAVTLYFAIWL